MWARARSYTSSFPPPRKTKKEILAPTLNSVSSLFFSRPPPSLYSQVFLLSGWGGDLSHSSPFPKYVSIKTRYLHMLCFFKANCTHFIPSLKIKSLDFSSFFSPPLFAQSIRTLLSFCDTFPAPPLLFNIFPVSPRYATQESSLYKKRIFPPPFLGKFPQKKLSRTSLEIADRYEDHYYYEMTRRPAAVGEIERG